MKSDARLLLFRTVPGGAEGGVAIQRDGSVLLAIYILLGQRRCNTRMIPPGHQHHAIVEQRDAGELRVVELVVIENKFNFLIAKLVDDLLA